MLLHWDPYPGTATQLSFHLLLLKNLALLEMSHHGFSCILDCHETSR